jgi:hypothetical protein
MSSYRTGYFCVPCHEFQSRALFLEYVPSRCVTVVPSLLSMGNTFKTHISHVDTLVGVFDYFGEMK